MSNNYEALQNVNALLQEKVLIIIDEPLRQFL